LPELTAHATHVTGLDVSSQMIAAATRRCAGIANLALRVTEGRGLDGIGDGSVDLVLAVDSFPYVVQAGEALVRTMFAEAARVLRPGGAFVILDYSYTGDETAVRAHAEAVGLAVEREGERPFQLWDASAFVLRQTPSSRR
jgi:ubiquinone/menaquinone biosynthesis C-methylase UbiE